MDDRNRRVGIGALYVDVHEFHRVFDHPARFTPGLQPADRVSARADWIDEEVGELRDAKNIYDQADAYIDIIYFAVGGLVEIGVDPSELWRIVHGANMAKVQPDGTVKRREDGKIIKPAGWRAPDEAIAEEVNRQIGADATPLFDPAPTRDEGAPVEMLAQSLAGDNPALHAELDRRRNMARAGVAQAQGDRSAYGAGEPYDPRN